MYKVTRRLVFSDGKIRVGYGIKYKEIKFNNISCNKKDVEKLCLLCNRYSLDKVHLKDVVEDFLYEHKI